MSNYIINTTKKYIENYNKSIAEPEKFWSDLAKNNFSWYERWSKVLEWDFKKAKIEWLRVTSRPPRLLELGRQGRSARLEAAREAIQDLLEDRL